MTYSVARILLCCVVLLFFFCFVCSCDFNCVVGHGSQLMRFDKKLLVV